ncbi:signal peptidase II [Georgenia alba]|uniref:Lipoprotein signal peptidase n=1 Tax=Georgenia alba TaxID=2233858 RepID=A0ABW2QBR7_9MICO
MTGTAGSSHSARPSLGLVAVVPDVAGSSHSARPSLALVAVVRESSAMSTEPSTPPLRRRDLRRRAAGTSAEAEAAPVTVEPRTRRRLLVLLLGLTVVIAAVDQVTKFVAEARLSEDRVVPILGDLLGFQLVHNPGAAFSIATGMTWVFTIVMVVVAVAVLRVARKLGSTTWAVALGLLLGGCLGNLYDRLFRDPGFAVGHVVDFINYNGWFVGNVADIAIVAAAILIALLALGGREVDGTRATEPQQDESEATEPEPGESGETEAPADSAEPDDAVPGEIHPDGTQPDVTQADDTEPGDTEPGDTRPAGAHA